MKLSLNWLADYVNVPDTLQDFCDRLDLTGTGVEGIETIGDTFDNIVTAKVVSKERHPDSDHMWVCMVDVGDNNVDENGEPQPIQIVCGAQNFNEGDHIVTALVGAELPGDFKIKKSKLRGVVSNGMNCSERELGLGSDHDGIMILPEDAPVGVPFSEYLAKSDTVLDLEITPNRPDCLSVTGLAREIGAIYQIPVEDPLPEAAAELPKFTDGEDVSESVTVDIAESDRCHRYTARVIDNVKIGPSPDWLAERVIATGSRSINNVVDVTNYIMYLYGQPLHSFDYDKLLSDDGKAHVIIRPAEEGEELETLDGELRKLTPDMTVIATPENAVALAGVMGGMDSEVTDDTTTVLLEAATFDRAHTSRTSRALGLISEASMRYERGVDAAPIEEISAAASALLAFVSGGTVRPGIVDDYPVPATCYDLEFRTKKFVDFVGADIPVDYMVDVLERLGCKVDIQKCGSDKNAAESANASRDYSNEDIVLHVITPTFRPDLEREIDLYEEVLRLWGMDRVPSTMPSSPDRFGVQEESLLLRRKIDSTLRASGLNETMTYSFVDADDASKMGIADDAGSDAVRLMNPLSSDQSVMRLSIIPGLLRSVAYNQNHGTENIQLYEIGTVFNAVKGKKKPKERTMIAGVLAGSMDDKSWNYDPVPFDFFDGKGVLENLAFELALPKVRFKPLDSESAPQLQPGRAAAMFSGGIEIGWVGEIHPLVADAFGAKAPVVAFEISMDALRKAARPSRDHFDVPEFPPVTIDQAFIVGEDVTAEKMFQVMSSAGGKILEDVRLFDIYRDDEKIGPGKKSMAFALTYRAPDRTLKSEEVDKAHAKLIKKVSGATGAEVRA